MIIDNEKMANIIDNICNTLQEHKNDIANINDGKGIYSVNFHISVIPDEIPTLTVSKEYLVKSKKDKVIILTKEVGNAD